MSTSVRIPSVLLRTAGAAVVLGAVLAGPVGAQGTIFNVCYVPQVGAMYLIKRTGLPTACLSTAHTEVSWTTGSGGTVTSITGGPGLLGGTITTSGALSVNFAASGTATTVARSDHTHAVAGSSNTAVGANALVNNATGTANTAVGSLALNANTSGSGNTGLGPNALSVNTAGIRNTAVGLTTLAANIDGGDNSALGAFALRANTSGNNNVALGSFALYSNTTGIENTVVGASAFRDFTSGFGNTAIGFIAGRDIISGNGNIYINNPGGDESFTTRIGFGQQKAFIDGIRGRTTGLANAVAVLIDGAGQLGTVSSSRRFKEDIRDLAGASLGLLRLRPVSFRYKEPYADGSKPLQYGLIAEEVAEVYPGLVAYDSAGQPTSVLYHVLPTLLLNELQRQERELVALRQALAAQSRVVDELRAELRRKRS